jgi:hypothetical protein
MLQEKILVATPVATGNTLSLSLSLSYIPTYNCTKKYQQPNCNRPSIETPLATENSIATPPCN